MSEIFNHDQVLALSSSSSSHHLFHHYHHHHIGNLNGCPKLRKLWLFQNKIETISNLHSLPEIEELWLQSNNITKLNGFENNIMLKNLGDLINIMIRIMMINKNRLFILT